MQIHMPVQQRGRYRLGEHVTCHMLRVLKAKFHYAIQFAGRGKADAHLGVKFPQSPILGA